MKVWDLHCDTLSELRHGRLNGTPKNFEHNDLMIDLQRLKQSGYGLQCFACFVDLAAPEDPMHTALQEMDIFHTLLAQYPDDLVWVRTDEDVKKLENDRRIGAMLTVEEGGTCHGDPAILRDFYRLGVRMMTLTWNHKNELAEPNVGPDYNEDTWPVAPNITGGLTDRGVEFVREMERLHMIVDVAHLSDAGIRDVLQYSTRPFAASHSNARACCPHVRNLPDDLLRAMGEKGCLIGLNFCPAFLDEGADRHHLISRVTDMARHARYIMDLAGEDALALGSDFDGIGGELEIAGAQDMPRLAEGLCKAGLTETQVEKIFWGNAARFFAENL